MDLWGYMTHKSLIAQGNVTLPQNKWNISAKKQQHQIYIYIFEKISLHTDVKSIATNRCYFPHVWSAPVIYWQIVCPLFRGPKFTSKPSNIILSEECCKLLLCQAQGRIQGVGGGGGLKGACSPYPLFLPIYVLKYSKHSMSRNYGLPHTWSLTRMYTVFRQIFPYQ